MRSILCMFIVINASTDTYIKSVMYLYLGINRLITQHFIYIHVRGYPHPPVLSSVDAGDRSSGNRQIPCVKFSDF